MHNRVKLIEVLVVVVILGACAAIAVTDLAHLLHALTPSK